MRLNYFVPAIFYSSLVAQATGTVDLRGTAKLAAEIAAGTEELAGIDGVPSGPLGVPLADGPENQELNQELIEALYANGIPYDQQQGNPSSDERSLTTHCATDKDVCPDGTYVARDYNDGCRFSPCPDSKIKRW
eukprot:CAMPEP_0194309542 /NCGR_PEP_ID=MMETSP0171-20130528/6519_1 /TAXON_ID=218684 /ORGANISM="Corethron pennatum, Strain L29A3" /LENGTH=133 /DNA_ID=CAMNT_0039062753 /DNA_START=29 /DNA_END=427 /DNA_ORIENTATION=+